MFVRTTAINKIRALTKRIRAVKGGTSGGKTQGILPELINKAIKFSGKRITVTSENLPHLKKGAIRDFKAIMQFTGRWNADNWHSTDSIYTFSNGSYIEFFSADDEGKMRGPRRDILYVNEANRLDFEVYRQAAKRTNEIIYLDWNPTHSFWFDKEIKGGKNVDFITLTYLDNEAAPQAAIDDILEAKQKGFFNPDLEPPELFNETNIKSAYWSNDYRVYGLGLTGKLQGTVFEYTEGTFDDSLPYCYGLDFGFNPDPCGLVKVAVDQKNKKIYLEEKAYLTDLGTDAIEKLLRNRNPENKMIIADSAGKLTIHDLRQKGINIIPAIKGPGSIESSIKSMMNYEIIVCGESPNLETEFLNYTWNDRKSGVPIDKYNHLIDPTRYAFVVLARGSSGVL